MTGGIFMQLYDFLLCQVLERQDVENFCPGDFDAVKFYGGRALFSGLILPNLYFSYFQLKSQKSGYSQSQFAIAK